MQSDTLDINSIIAREYAGNITPSEKKLLDEWYKVPENEAFYQELTNEEEIVNGLAACVVADQELSRLEEEIFNDFLQREKGKVRRLQFLQYAAAACILLVIGVPTYLIFTGNKQEKAPANITYNQLQDVLPGADKAVLTLADGSKVVLEDAQNGIITTQGNTQIAKKDGELMYEVKGKPSIIPYNTLATPRGGQYRITLPDGSKAWLNAASSIRYPVAFTGKERSVEISGEVYFEVAKNTRMPFKVEVLYNGAGVRRREVEVLGTHFNINAYADEPVIKATLLEGKIRVHNGHAEKIMAPGQMTKLSLLKDSIETEAAADTEQAVAWKNGFFDFNNCDLETVMRQIGRWYDVELDIDAQVPNIIFMGKIERNKPLKTVLEILRKSDSLDFQTTERRLRVSRRINKANSK